MKKISLLVLIAMLLMVILTACGNGNPPADDPDNGGENTGNEGGGNEGGGNEGGGNEGGGNEGGGNEGGGNEGGGNEGGGNEGGGNEGDDTPGDGTPGDDEPVGCQHVLEKGVCVKCNDYADFSQMDIESAVGLGITKDDKVLYGTLNMHSHVIPEADYNEQTNSVIFDKSEGYFHFVEEMETKSNWGGTIYEYNYIYENWYYLLNDGSVWAVEKQDDYDPTRQTWGIIDANVRGYQLYGYDMVGLNELTDMYGAADLLNTLYTYAINTDYGIVNSTIEVDPSTGIYVFAFQFAEVSTWELYEYTVGFALDADSYYINALAVSMQAYTVFDDAGDIIDVNGTPAVEFFYVTDDDGNLVLDGNGDPIPAYYVLNEDIETFRTLDITYAQSDVAVVERDDTYGPSTLAMSDFDILDKDGNNMLAYLELVVGTNYEYTISNVVPVTADFNFDTITVYDENGDELGYSECGWFLFDSYTGTLSITMRKAGLYNITIRSAFLYAEVTIEASLPPVTEFAPTVGGVQTTETSVITGGTLNFDAYVNYMADNSFTAEITSGDSATAVVDYDASWYFKATAAGTYVITLTSTADESFTATLTVTVVDPTPFDPEAAFSEVWSGSDYWNVNSATVTFTPNADPTTGTVEIAYSYSSGWGSGTDVAVYNYEYVEADRAIVLTTDGWDMYGFTLSINADATLTANCGGTDIPLAISEPVEDTPFDPAGALDKSYSGGNMMMGTVTVVFTPDDATATTGTVTITLTSRGMPITATYTYVYADRVITLTYTGEGEDPGYALTINSDATLSAVANGTTYALTALVDLDTSALNGTYTGEGYECSVSVVFTPGADSTTGSFVITYYNADGSVYSTYTYNYEYVAANRAFNLTIVGEVEDTEYTTLIVNDDGTLAVNGWNDYFELIAEGAADPNAPEYSLIGNTFWYESTQNGTWYIWFEYVEGEYVAYISDTANSTDTDNWAKYTYSAISTTEWGTTMLNLTFTYVEGEGTVLSFGGEGVYVPDYYDFQLYTASYVSLYFSVYGE